MKKYYQTGEYYQLIIDLSLQMIDLKDDYGDKKKVRKHNAAVTKLYKFIDHPDFPKIKPFLLKLLDHEHPRVVQNAAICCFIMNCYEKEAILALTKVSRCAKDSIVRFEAEHTIEVKEELKTYFSRKSKT